jgi:hypothetical protein
MVALTLVRIFPNLWWIDYIGGNWAGVSEAIRLSERPVDRSSKKHSLTTPRSNLSDQ